MKREIMAVTDAFAETPDIYRVGHSSWTNGPKIWKIVDHLSDDRISIYDKNDNLMHALLKNAVNIHYVAVD